MEDHRLAVPLRAFDADLLETSGKGSTKAAAFRGTRNTSAPGKPQSFAATGVACMDSHVHRACAPASVGDSNSEAFFRQRKESASSGGTRRNSSVAQDGLPTSASPDGSYISSPFFSGSPMDFPETLQPRVMNVTTDMRCSLSTPLEKFFDVLDSSDIPVATPSPLATVCTHHTTSPAAEPFPLNGPGTQEADEPEKARTGRGRPARLSASEGLHGGSAFPIRPPGHSPEKRRVEGQVELSSISLRYSDHGEKPRSLVAESGEAGLGANGGAHAIPGPKALQCAANHSGLSNVTAAASQDKPHSSVQVTPADADRLLVDFQLLLILLFDQVCNVVPGLRRQDGGAFYSMHLQRIAAGPLHPTLASYADVLLPICSAMSFFSGGDSNDQRLKKQEEQDGILSVALRYLARHGAVPAAPIAEMVAKCPAAVFIQVVSALECMYSLQRILAPGGSDFRGKISEELDPKTIWGDAVAEVEKAASVLAEECISSSLPPRASSEESFSRPSSPPLLIPANRIPKRPRVAAAPACNIRQHKPAAIATAAAHDSQSDLHEALSGPLLTQLSLTNLTGTAATSSSTLNPLSGGHPDSNATVGGRGESAPAFIPASVNKRRHPNVQAEILNSCCPERLAQRGSRLLGEVLQKLQCEQAMRPPPIKTNSPKQAFAIPDDQPDAAMRHQEANCGAPLQEEESDSLSSESARGKRKLSTAGEQFLADAHPQLAAVHQTPASSSSADPEETMQAEVSTDVQLKKHGYGLRKGGAKKGRKPAQDEGGPVKSRTRLTPVKPQNPHQTRVKKSALSPSENSPHDPGLSSLPPSLAEQLMKLASGADGGDFPAALSSTMRGVFFNRSLNRWVCTWSRNGKEYQRSWSAGKYGYETARGLAMHCRLEKLLSGEAHTLQKGMLAVFKPIMNSQTAHASGVSAVPLPKAEDQGADDADRRKPEVPKPRVSPRPPSRMDNAPREAESDLVATKTEATHESTGPQKAQTGSTYSDMLTLMSQAISRKPGAFTEDAPETVVKPAESEVRDEIKELADPSVGEHFLAAVAAAAAACDVPGFDD